MPQPFRSRSSLFILLLASPLSWGQAQPAGDLTPVLDEAVAQEHRGDYRAAHALYGQALSMAPDSRQAQLGLARIARADYRFSDARAIYLRLLQADPDDFEAANGLAWIAMANFQDETAQAGFDAVLAKQPANAEALAGLAGVDTPRRYQLDLSAGPLRNDAGTSWGGGVQLIAALDATSSMEVAAGYNSVELPTANPLEATTLPSNLLRLGYRWQIPGRYGAAIAYEHRGRNDSPTEQRVEISGIASVNERFQVFGGLRKGFGTGWEAQVVHAGVTANLVGAWEVAATVFSESRASFGNAQVVAMDVIRQGPGHALLVVGASRGNNPRLTDVHGGLVYPISEGRALTVTARYNTFYSESQVLIGWRQYWN